MATSCCRSRGTILIHLARKSRKLIPAGPGGEAHVIRWCFSVLDGVELATLNILLIDDGFGIFADHPSDDNHSGRRFVLCLPYYKKYKFNYDKSADFITRHFHSTLIDFDFRFGDEWLARQFHLCNS